MVAAPASRQGKTLFSAALARQYHRQGYKVQVFKIGPDFLDPKILEQASGKTVGNLDLWMMGELYCRQQIQNARQVNDIVLIESVMGLFDHQPSNADFSLLFDIPILLLINASSMGASFAAIAHGLVSFQPSLKFLGVVANCVGSNNHQTLITENLPDSINFLGSIPRDKRMKLPERHLGLYQPEEMENIDTQLDESADVLSQLAIKIHTQLRVKKNQIESKESNKGKDFVSVVVKPSTKNKKVAIARDAAFSFIYPENLKILESLGCDLVFFSPLKDKSLPSCDVVWLPGGYPELHAQELSNNTEMRQSIISHVKKNKVIFAECGGMLYLFESLKTKQGNRYPMCGLLLGKVIMEAKFQGIGLQKLDIFEGATYGHSFHHARINTPLKPFAVSQHQREGGIGEEVYRVGNIYASFLHCWLASSEMITKKLFGFS